MTIDNLARIETLGERTHASPLARDESEGDCAGRFFSDEIRVPLIISHRPDETPEGQVYFEKAGPHRRLFFDPARTKAAIVTCGGLCPGLNNVIRSAVYELAFRYRVSEIIGIRYGYHGMDPANGHAPLRLTTEDVSDIHEVGGTILGTARGPVESSTIVSFLRSQGVNILLTVGGDGTQRGARSIHEEAVRQGYPLAVVGVPKTIDNDIQFVSQTFGYTTAIDVARSVIDGAHTEARAVLNGIGLVKLMGRDSGFIAAGAALASGEVNFVLIPEVPFELEGDSGFLAVLERRLAAKRHAVIVVAEGAGQELTAHGETQRDASGNVKLADIGLFLKERIQSHLARLKKPVNVRYIDPSYIVRSRAASSEDAVLCDALARNAVHAAMAGKTNLIVGYLHNTFLHVPISMAVEKRKKVDPNGTLWRAVLDSTGQPLCFRNS